MTAQILVALGGGVAPLSGDAYGSFAALSNGALSGNSATGEPYRQDTTSADPNRVVATISSGALVAAASGTGVTGAYSGWRLREDMKSFYADVSFGDANDVAAMISAADVTLTAILDSSIHITIQAAAYNVQWYADGVNTNVTNGSFASVAFGVSCRVGWRLSGNDVYVLLPNGTEVGPITSSAVATRANHCAIFEHYRGSSGAPGLKFYAAAANIFANPTAAGRTNLLVGQDDITNAAWSKSNFGTPTTGLPDSDGGTLADQILETTTNGGHSFLQQVTKAAAIKRYTRRLKIKPVGRDWAEMDVFNGAFSASGNRYLNMTTGAFGTESGTFADKTWMIYSLGNGWYQLQFDFSSDANANLQAYFGLATADTAGSYAGDITKGMIVFDQWLFERPL